MKIKNLFLLLILSLSSSINFAQNSLLPDKKMEEKMREFIRDPASYDHFIAGITLEKKFKQGLINEKEYISEKNELKRLQAKRKKSAKDQKTVIAGASIAAGAETTLAVNPNDPNQVVATFMINGAMGGCAVYYSADGGTTWSPSTFIPENMIMSTIAGVTSVDGGGDPTITVDNNGIFYFAWIGVYTTPSGHFYSTLYVTSANGGLSFTAPSSSDFTITAYNMDLGFGFLDRIWIAADAASGSSAGTVYLNGMLYGVGDGGQVVYVKPNSSATFTQSVNESIPAAPGYLSQLANIEVGDNGIVHASGVRYDGASSTSYGEVVYSRSSDHGVTWSVPVIIAHAIFSGTAYSFYEENAAPSLGVDSGTVYLAWTDLDPLSKVFYAVSTDDGLTWSAPINIGSAICPGPYYHTFINLSPSNGNCSMAWYRVDSISLQADYVMAEVMNDGALPVNSEVISPGTISFSPDFFGHYNVSRRNGCITHAIWVDGSSGMATVYTAKVNACELGTEVTPVSAGIVFNSVYPVPAEDRLQTDFSIDADGMYTISVFDIKGQKVRGSLKSKFSKGKNNFSLDVSTLSPGTYLLRVEKDTGVYLTRKFIKK